MNWLWLALVHSDKIEKCGTIFDNMYINKVTCEETNGLLASMDELVDIVNEPSIKQACIDLLVF